MQLISRSRLRARRISLLFIQSDLKPLTLGSNLMQHLLKYAKSERLQELHGSVLASNTAIPEMCRGLGFVVEAEPGDPGSTPHVLLNLRER